MSEAPKDTRFVYGARCTWFGPISAIGKSPSGLPACPHCGSMLFELKCEADWWAGVDRFEAKGNPGYRALVEWMADKHFMSYAEAKAAYADHMKGMSQ